MVTRTPRKTSTAKKTTRKTTAKTSNKPTTDERTTTVDLRHPLPVRRRLFVGPTGPSELAAIRAALAAAAARLPVPVRAWNGPTAHLDDGTVLTHTPPHATTDQPPTFIAHVPCTHGAHHEYLIHTTRDLAGARAVTRTCETHHGSEPADTAITRGVGPAPQPKPPVVLQLREGVRRATAATAETQPLSLTDITDGLTTRTADTEQPKEHPQP